MYHSIYETLTPEQRVIVSYRGKPYFKMVLITKPYLRTFENTFPQMSKSDILRKSTDIHQILKDNECLVITKNKQPVWLIKRENNVRES
jgi:hypothetical protein